MGSSYFSVTTTNRTATQLTFTVPPTYYNSMSHETETVNIGTYSLMAARGKSLTLTAAAVVVSVNAEEIARQAVAAASAKREVERRSARESIINKFKSDEKITLETFAQAEVNGITPENFDAVQLEISALPASPTGDISGILKIARKYEVVGIIASERVTTIYSDNLIEIGLIPIDSKNKATLTNIVKNLPLSDRSSYVAIQEVIAIERTTIQARKDRYAAILARITSRQNG